MERLFIVLLIAGIISSDGDAQTSESGNYNCTYSKEIVIPFNRSRTGEEVKNPPLDQNISYTDNIDFSYWYKIIAKTDTIIGCRVEPIENRDSYVLLVYQYNKNNFCEQVYYQKIR